MPMYCVNFITCRIFTINRQWKVYVRGQLLAHLTALLSCHHCSLYLLLLSYLANKLMMMMMINTATLSTRTHLTPKPAQLNHVIRGHSRSRILGSLKSRRRTAYYYIILWALESEILKERSEHLRFREPECHSAPHT